MKIKKSNSLSKLDRSKKSQFGMIGIIIVAAIIIFGLSGVIHFAFFQDKTVLIIIGIIILFILLRRRT